MSKSFEQLISEINSNVEKEDFEKQASSGSNLTDLWMQATGSKPKEDEEMYDFVKQAAAEEDALNTMCIHYAYDALTAGMTKQASMNKEAAQRLVIGHCMQFGWSPEQCIMKEASDRAGGVLSDLTQAGTQAFWAGFMKAAANDASAGPADGASGTTPNSVSDDYNGFKAQAQNVDEAVGTNMPIDGSGTIESMIAKVLSGSGSNYGYQGVLSHPFLPKA